MKLIFIFIYGQIISVVYFSLNQTIQISHGEAQVSFRAESYSCSASSRRPPLGQKACFCYTSKGKEPFLGTLTQKKIKKETADMRVRWEERHGFHSSGARV